MSHRATAHLPLAGYRAVALEQAVAAPLCSRHLADLGAEVIKVERPDGGDFARRYDAVVHGESAYFVWLNRGKRSIVLDLGHPADREVFDALLGTADVFLHNLGPGAAERLGYGAAHVRTRWPRLVTCAVSGYGSDGPFRDRKAFDLLIQGEAGLASVTGTPEQPSKVGVSIADIGAGMYALASILAALVAREQTGDGAALDASMFDSLAEWMSVPALYQRYAGSAPPRTGLYHATIAPYGPYQAADGPAVLIAIQNEGQWTRLCVEILAAGSLVADRRFATNALRVQHRAELDAQIAEAFGAIPRATLLERLEAADIPYAAVNDLAAVLVHPQLVERGRWVETATPSGPMLTIAPPLGEAAAAGVPALGADSSAIRRELGFEP